MPTYTDRDLDDAVAAGALTSDAARALRAHVADRAAAAGDAERFRLVAGFNDVFVVVAGMLLLVAAAQMAGEWIPLDPAAGLVVMGLSWGLAEAFTRRRRMALPSIVFLLAFAVSAFWLGFTVFAADAAGGCTEMPLGFCQDADFQLLAGFLFAALAAAAHWRRFRVPITVAAGTAGLIGTAVFALAEIDAVWTLEWLRPLVLLAGLATFAWAMRWDLADPARRARSSDVAFWLHLLAAPMIVHVLYNWAAELPAATAVTVGMYVLLGAVALVIDRRVLLVAGLLYVVGAVAGWLEEWSALADFGLAAFLIGAVLLALSVYWRALRVPVMARLPAAWRERLPPA